MRSVILATCIAIGLAPQPGAADLAPVRDEAAFLDAIGGKVLTRPLIRLQVRGDGTISGTGATRSVTGQWQWQNGYFCRDLIWGKRDLGHNCQEVRLDGRTIRFTSDRGGGDFADFRIVDP